MLRSTTNLVIPKDLQLDKIQMKEAFMYVYNKGYTGLEPVFINKLWMSTFMPGIANSPNFGKNRKNIREWATYASKNAFAGLMELKKVNDPSDPHFLARIPLATFNRYDAHTAYNRYNVWFTSTIAGDDADDAKNDLDRELRDTDEQMASRVVMGRQAIRNIKGIDAKALKNLDECLLDIRLTKKGNLAAVFADFKISAAEAQQLTTTEWMLIRNIDLYPLLMQWVAGQFGFSDDAPTASFPISKIANTLPPVGKGDARVNAQGLSIDPKGNPMWLPKELNNTSRYEDRFSIAGDQGGDGFALMSMDTLGAMEDPTKAVTKLPPNIPVLIDWVNKKYAYTMSTGLLKVQDLSRFKAADAAHIQNLLNRLYPHEKQILGIAAVASAANVEPVVKFTADEINEIAQVDSVIAEKFSKGSIAIRDYWTDAEEFAYKYIVGSTESSKYLTLGDLSPNGEAIFRPLARYFKQALAACLQNIDVINLKYSVAGTTTTLGTLTLLNYAGNEAVMLEAAAIKGPATNQGVDPDWEPPSCPLLRSDGNPPIGLLPHQKKVRNLLKDSPDFAILPVQAGGGKSVLTITDVLYEIKANRNAPYLILCPAHLVAQYAKEIVFFTGSKMNVIPINTNSMLRNGFKRLTEMLEHAPRNTVVVADYDALRAKPRKVCYGTTTVTIYPVIEFLRQFAFGYAMLDESHSVKNDSQRTRACMTLIADIPKKRLASGTMAHDSPSDLAMQIGMLDPTVFGSREDFNDRFGAKVSGDRVVTWKPQAQQDIMKAIKSRVVVAGAMRKEWAALLPTAEEEFLGVELTPNQYVVYNAIFSEGIERMREDAKHNATLQKFFESRGLLDAGKTKLEDEEQDADENAGDDLVSMLGFYLARVEQFITAPGADEMGARLLKGDDLISPKVLKIIERIRLHLDKGYPGKVLVFTNYTDSAEAIFNALPEDLKKQSLLYVASEKTETGAAFENDERFKVMIGVENSMNTGLNLQFVSRLIRTETVWNPGTLEQGNSRVNRPNLKQEEARSRIFYDWIVANNTFDITKISRLISKVIAVGKFENTDNPAYDEIEDVPVIKLNEESILTMNSWESLLPYGQAYGQYRQVRDDEYREYREKHGKLKLDEIAVAPTPKDASIMERVPYAPGLELFNAGKLGLVRVDEFLRMDEAAIEKEEEDSGEESEEAMSPAQKARMRAAEMLVGKPVHTEFGDGIIKNVRMRGRRVNVRLNSGGITLVNMSAAFVPKGKLKLPDMRKALIAQIGDMPIQPAVNAPIPLLKPDVQGDKRALKEKLLEEKRLAEEEAQRKAITNNLNIELFLNVSNGFLGLTYFVEDDNAKAAVQALGFRPSPPFVMAELKSALGLRRLFDAWKDKGYSFDPKFQEMRVPDAFTALYNMLKTGKVASGASGFTFGTKNNLRNFFREEAKPSAKKKEFKPYPMVEDGTAYVIMQTRGQAAVPGAIRVQVPGIKWEKGADTMVYYGLDLAQTGQKIKEIQALGIEIANIVDLKKQFTAMRKTKLRKAE